MEKDNNLEEKMQDSEKAKVYWHDAFYQALQMELHEYKDDLIFEYQHQLSKEALKMDVLVIKKKTDKKIGKNIGRIFKRQNVFEFKSEKNNLSVWDYNRVIGYAMIYSAFEKIPIEDITVSYVVTPKPTKLLKYLESERDLGVDEICRGIYNIDGEPFPVQIILSKQLSAKENVFLKNLRSELTRKDMVRIVEAYRKYGSPGRKNAYFDRVFGANKTVLREVLAMETVWDEVISEYLKESGKGDELVEDYKRETALEMISRGFEFDEIAEILKVPVTWVQSLLNEFAQTPAN